VEPEDFAAKCRKLTTLVVDAAPGIARAQHSVILKTAAAGQDPSGTAWPDTAKGERPLRNAAGNIETWHARVGGKTIVKTVAKKQYALHDLDRANGAPRRQILPDEITDDLDAALTAALSAEFEEVFK